MPEIKMFYFVTRNGRIDAVYVFYTEIQAFCNLKKGDKYIRVFVHSSITIPGHDSETGFSKINLHEQVGFITVDTIRSYH